MSYGPPNYSPGQSPYAAPQFGAPAPSPKKGMSVGCIVGIIAAVVIGGGGLVCCGSVVGLGFFGISTLTKQVETQLRANPVVQAQLGEIRSCTYNYQATGERTQKGQSNTFVFDLKGTKGDGQAVVQTTSDGSLRIVSGTLTTPQGSTVPLVGPAFPGMPGPFPGF